MAGTTDPSLAGVLEAARDASTSSTDKGDRFERLCHAALTAHDGRDGTQRFKRIWLWSDQWPNKKPHDGVDTGIDLVAEQTDGSLAAIQCKFYTGEVATEAVDSFLAASSRQEFESRIIMTTGSGFGRHGENKLRNAHPRCEVFDTSRMTTWSVDWWQLAEESHAVAPGTPQRRVHARGTRVYAAINAAKRLSKRYQRRVAERSRRAGEHVSTAKRAAWRVLVALEAVIVGAVAVVAAAAIIAVAVAVVMLVAAVTVLTASSKGKRPRRPR